MDSTNRFRHDKGQILSSDAIIAALLVLFIIYLTFSVQSGMKARAQEAQERDALLSKTISVADYLMKEGLVHKERSEMRIESDRTIEIACSHSLERGKISAIDAAALAERAGLQSLCFSLVALGEPTPCASAPVCIRRPAIIYETGEVGYLAVCAG